MFTCGLKLSEKDDFYLFLPENTNDMVPVTLTCCGHRPVGERVGPEGRRIGFSRTQLPYGRNLTDR
jgi:hypothetical protein